MQYYIVLTIATALFVLLGVLLWLKTRNLAFPLGLAFVYYTTLYGAWFLVYDKLRGESGGNYAYLEGKMFPIFLDEHYMFSLLIYSVFTIVLAGSTLLLVRSQKKSAEHESPPLVLYHGPIILICASAAFGSYLIVREGLSIAIGLNVPAYELMKRGFGDVPPLFTLHQVLNRVALIPATIGLVAMLSGKHPRLLEGKFSLVALSAYSLIIGGMITLAFLLGYKSEIFYAGLVGCLFYLGNARRPKLLIGGAAGFAVLVGMWLVDTLRWVSIADLPTALLLLSTDVGDTWQVFSFIVSSNEAFASHFSLYGVLALDVPITYGLSFVSLAASLVPRILWPDRLSDIYFYYADSVNAEPGQGYTIHHATGWYLNFGMVGVAIGAIAFAIIWAKCFNLYVSIERRRSKATYVFSSIAPWTFSAYIPFLMHAGPEVYKGLVIDAFLLPTIVLTLATLHWRIAPRTPGLLAQ